MEIRLFGTQGTDFRVLLAKDKEEEPPPFKLSVRYDIEEREGDALVTIVIEVYAYIKDKSVIGMSTSMTGFQLIADDLAFLKQPASKQMTDLLLEPTQIAIAHARVFTLLACQDNNLGNVFLRHIGAKELETLTTEASRASLN